LVGLLATSSLSAAYAAAAALLGTALCANHLARPADDAGVQDRQVAIGRARVPGPVKVVSGIGWSVYASTHSYATGMTIPGSEHQQFPVGRVDQGAVRPV
jgi:hypothetical protein